ncbi:MAG: hypothetical protein HOZ81_24745 [Streptomyces sp.]|nr:hypothetical protein [Streptomyces sp.]
MTPAETAELLGLCAAFDRRTIGKTDVLAWQTVLADIDPDAAKQAVTAHYAAETRWIMPADIRATVQAQRAARLAQHTDPTPTADPDDLTAYKAEIIATRRAVAAGHTPPATHELTAGPMHPDVAARLHALGHQPPHDVNDTRAISSIRRPGPLGIPCPTCRAAIGRPCKTPSIDNRAPRERPPHAARKRAATTNAA